MNKIEIAERVLEELRAERGVELVIVTATEGSSPRSAGAWMALFEDGGTAGTVGGGRVEDLAYREASQLLAEGASRAVRYTMGGRGSDTGMICGGALSLCFLCLDSAAVPALERERDILTARGEGVFSVDLSAFQPGPSAPNHGAASAVTIPGCPDLAVVQMERQAEICAGIHGDRYLEPICPEGFTYIIGCGHVGRACASVLAAAGFVVVACDERPEFLTEELLPQAARRTLVDYANLAANCRMASRDLVISATATHESDLSVVSQALAAGPAYLGCLGSRKKTAFIKGELIKRGFSREQVDGIHLPIGLPIHAETPEEIAVSIAAELIDFRRTHLLPRP